MARAVLRSPALTHVDVSKLGISLGDKLRKLADEHIGS